MTTTWPAHSCSLVVPAFVKTLLNDGISTLGLRRGGGGPQILSAFVKQRTYRHLPPETGGLTGLRRFWRYAQPFQGRSHPLPEGLARLPRLPRTYFQRTFNCLRMPPTPHDN